MSSKLTNVYEERKPLLNAGKEYILKGLSVLSTNSQKEPTTLWKLHQTAKPTYEQLIEMFARENSAGIAVITGKVSENLEVVDIDIKYDNSGKLYEQLCSMMLQQQPELFEKLFKVKTTNGGFHWYYRCSNIQRNQKLASRHATEDEKEEHPDEKIKVLIETRGEGGYVLAPPSAGYEFCDEDEYNIKEITPEERDNLFWICKTFNEVVEVVNEPAFVKKQKKNYLKTPWDDYNERGQEDMIERLQNYGWINIKESDCKVIFKRPGNTKSVSSGDFCFKRNLFTVFTTSSQFTALKGYTPAGVFTMLECNNNWTIANKKLIDLGYGQKNINNKEGLEDVQQSAFNIMQEHFSNEMIYKNLITHFCESEGKVLNEQTLNSHFINLYDKNKKVKGMTKPNFDIFINSKNIDSKHPIKEYFESLPVFDKKNTIADLAESLNLKPHKGFDKYAASLFLNPTREFVVTLLRKWLVGMVASVYDGNYNPLMVVLIGPKNTGKTEFFRRLLPEPLKKYFAQSKFNEGKDSEALMCEKILILNDELDGMNRNDAKTFRNFISQDNYTYRPPYGKQNITVKRLATVCGTSNETEIINDPENNRRIIPIEISGIDYEKYNSIKKEMLLSEVYSLYKAGESWNLTLAEITLLDEFMKGYELGTIERELINNLFTPASPDEQGMEVLTMAEMINELHDYSPSTRIVHVRLGKELAAMGFKQKSIRKGKQPVRGYQCIRVGNKVPAKLSNPIK